MPIPMHYLLGCSLLFLSWLMPLHFPPWVSWHSEILAFLAIVFLAWHSLFRAAKRSRSVAIDFPASALLLLALVLLVWLQTVTGMLTFAGDALVLTLYLGACVVCLALGWAASKQHQTHSVLAWTLLLGAFFSAVVAFVQAFDLWETSPWINRMLQLRRPGGNLGQPNQLATLLLMGLASLLFLFESRKLTILPTVLFALTLLTGVASTESRTGVVSFLGLTLWWFAKRKSMVFRLSPWVALLAGAGFLGLLWNWPSFMGAVLQTSGSGAVVDTSVGARAVVWPQLLEATLQRPWLGWGLGQVSVAQNAVVHAYASSGAFSYSHNIVLDLALGLGLPLTGLIMMVVSVWLWRRVRAIRQLTPWYFLALVLPVAVHSMLEFPFAYAYFLVPVMFALGALEGMTGAQPAFRLNLKPVAAALFVTTGLMVWSAAEYVAIEEDFRVMRFEALRIGRTPVDYQRPRILLLTQLDAMLDGGRIVPNPGMTEDELDLARRVALHYHSPAAQNRYALSLALNGNPQEAIRQMRVIRALHGEESYAQIKENWASLADDKYPQLLELKLP